MIRKNLLVLITAIVLVASVMALNEALSRTDIETAAKVLALDF